MSDSSLTSSDGRAWPWRLLAGFLILAAAGARLAYLASGHALDLAPDEAHYWDWSRQLDWSYFSKGPLVAYLIRASCELTGAWSQQLVGSEMLAVRLPAVVCGSLLLVSLYVLTVQVTGREKLAATVVAFGLTLPVLAAGSTLMTIDAPYTCCWGWALVLGHRAVLGRANWAWPATGLVVGLGVLAKYTMILWLPSLALFLLASAEYRPLLRRRGFWVLCALAGAAGWLPVLWWNWQHDWVTLRHVGGQAGLSGPAGVRWLGPLTYTATQFGLLLGFWFVPWLMAMIRYRPKNEAPPAYQYLWWMSAPMFGVFLLSSLRTPGQPNWPVTAYLSGGVLAAAWLAEQAYSPQTWYRRLTWGLLGMAGILGVVLTLLLHDSTRAYPLLRGWAGEPTAARPLPMRRLDPTCRLRGWRELAATVDRLRAELTGEKDELVLAGSSWMLPGELAFYCAGHPTVFSLGVALGDRHSQYDLWRPNPVWDEKAFRRKTFLFVGDLTATVREAFDCVEEPRQVVHHSAGQPVASWTVTVCRGYRGFGRVPSLQGVARF